MLKNTWVYKFIFFEWMKRIMCMYMYLNHGTTVCFHSPVPMLCPIRQGALWIYSHPFPTHPSSMALSCLLQKANWKHTDWTGAKGKLSLLLIITTGYQPNLGFNLLFQSRFPLRNLQGVSDLAEMELIFPTAVLIVLSFVLAAGKVLVTHLCFVYSWARLHNIRAVLPTFPPHQQTRVDKV